MKTPIKANQEALPQRFLVATSASKVLPQPVNIRVNPRPSAVKKSDPEISDY
jgi:hypothetical protein